MKKILAAAALSLCVSLPAAAADEWFKLKTDQSMQAVLSELSGKTVTLHLRGGKSYTGKIGTVGPRTLQVMELSGKEFYDAVITIDSVDAVELRARNQ